MADDRRYERFALPVAGLTTAALLVVMLYYPVATVLVAAVRPEGALTLDPLFAVLSDPFYVGALAGAIQNPAGVPAGVAAWAAESVATVAAADGPLAAFGALVAVFPAFGLFGFTAYQAFLSTLASLALGLPGAYLLARFEFPGRRTVESLTAVPFVLPSIMVAVGFVAAFGSNGALNDFIRATGLPTVRLVWSLSPFALGYRVNPSPPTFDLLFTLEIIVLAHAFYNAPLVTRIVAASWESVDARAVETARSLGASPLRAFRDVVVPQLLPAILTGALLTFIFTFMSFPIILALGGLELATVEVWLFDRVQQLKLTEAAALAVLETVVSLALTYAYLSYESRTTGTDRAVSPLPRERLAGAVDLKRGALLLYGVVVVVVFLLPLVSMVAESVTAPSGTGFTTQYYGYLLEREAAQVTVQTKPGIAVRNSLLFGVGTLLLAVPMGVVIAFVTARDSALSRFLGTASMLPFAVSGIVIGLGLLDGLVFGIRVAGVRLAVVGPLAIVAAHAVGAYPFVVRNVAPLLGDLDRRLVESARALGATRGRALVDVELPLVAPGLAAGAAFAFAISIGEFDSTVILAEGSRAYTMPVAVERFLTDRTLGPATAMGTVLLVVTAAAFVVIDRVGGRYRE